jgi:hypothetical protein
MDPTLLGILVNVGLVLLGYFLRHKGITIPGLPGPPPSLPVQAVKSAATWAPAVLAGLPVLSRVYEAIRVALSPPASLPPAGGGAGEMVPAVEVAKAAAAAYEEGLQAARDKQV